MANRNRLKAGLGAIVLLVLILLNIKKYWLENDAGQTEYRTYNEVAELIIPPALTDDSSGGSTRDIFVRLDADEISSSEHDAERVEEDPAPASETVQEKVADIGSYKDIDLLGVSMRAEASMALIRYDGRSYYVAVGDVVGGRYFIERIDESGVYVSTK
ncbi:hypothetical protein [Marinobacter excellens]|jgi:Tfp pilus assembly protein PilP|uniref:hypothetical protein n=1 Tax=Marinobacter excellens TaxID=218670 RepID=UPI0007733828|nr:hypothetical protein [Marinobacter excellens]